MTTEAAPWLLPVERAAADEDQEHADPARERPADTDDDDVVVLVVVLGFAPASSGGFLWRSARAAEHGRTHSRVIFRPHAVTAAAN
ncbi:hypothetical protein ABZ923_34980 [Streptomyces sp. NPDC046881]|uniref:hypothetical protein n=1 Tax=Streptomyces sp. NPDC046881 TaxID=3155374 RepID=UPI0033C8D385